MRVILADEGCPLVYDSIPRLRNDFIHDNIVNCARDVDAQHLGLKVQSVKDIHRLRAFAIKVASLHNGMERLPFACLRVQVVHLKPEQVAVVDDNFPNGLHFSESDDEVPLILGGERCHSLQISIVQPGVIRFGSVVSERDVRAILR